jgi:HAD superfamily hydrolase (TIGR01549 family)
MSIKLIAFDLWSTLATRTNPNYHFSDNIKSKFNLDLTTTSIISIFEKIVQTKYWESEYDAYKEFARELEIAPVEKNIKKIINLREIAENNIQLYDFTIPLLKKLKKQKYKLGLVTNSSVFTYEFVKRKTDLFKYLDYVVFSFMVGFVKPEPEIFLKIQNDSKLENKEILMIGDTYSKDVLPSRKLGWNAIHFTGDYNKLKEDLLKYNIKI